MEEKVLMVKEEVVKRIIGETRGLIVDLENILAGNATSKSMTSPIEYTLGKINISVHILDELDLLERKEYAELKSRYDILFNKYIFSRRGE